MNGVYSFYKRDENGIQSEFIADFTSFEAEMTWGKPYKWTLSGITADRIQLSEGDRVIIYRNGAFLFGGIVEKMKLQCDDPTVKVIDWIAQGHSDEVLFSWRMVFPDGLDIGFQEDQYDQAEGSAYNRIIHYVRNCFEEGTIPSRRLYRLILPSEKDIGEEGLSAYRFQTLDKVIKDIGNPDDLYPVLTCNDKTGIYRMTIPKPRDMTRSVILSPDFGNIIKWEKTETLPEFNAIWVVSGKFSKGKLFVYAEDKLCVKKYGRIERVLNKSDIKPWEPEEPKEPRDTDDEESEAEEEVIENPEDRLTEEKVIALLEQEAQKELKKHGQKVIWSVEAAETNQMAFMDHWQLGDRVTCVIDGERFESQITKVKIKYEEGIETVEPSIGDVDQGLFGKLFDMISGLDDRMTEKENE